ncbi:MAG: lysophospholipid acyltransferase family protein [Bacteroidales bacterium]|jgi:KDO2-lipid IV(A) lauroyltransferase|nr:lysophospholipid acyltransferase family protein [Bacteroidales bacterium]
MYHFLYLIVYLHAVLPWKVLYLMADFLYCWIYHIAGYRKKIVRKNLTQAFPEKTPNEITCIEREFYHFFCDYIVETMKLAHISDDEMRRRMVFKNVDMLNDWLSTGKSCVMLLGHYGNWEWVSSLCLHWRKEIVAGQIYHPLNDKAFDRLLLKLRSRFGAVNIPMKNTLREIVRMRKSDIQYIIGFIADQRPLLTAIDYWTTFLNRETPMIDGFERIARQTGCFVAFLDVARTGRGYYEATFSLVSQDASTCQPFEIVEKYARAMEKCICKNPAHWLWTHDRWKFKKADWLKMKDKTNS